MPPADGVEVTQVAEGPSMWTCSMHPQIRQPNPGECPICGMDLIPVAKTSGGMRTLTISPEARALMNIETAPVERRYVSHAIRMVGKVDYDETKLGYITAWVSGRLDRFTSTTPASRSTRATTWSTSTARSFTRPSKS